MINIFICKNGIAVKSREKKKNQVEKNSSHHQLLHDYRMVKNIVSIRSLCQSTISNATFRSQVKIPKEKLNKSRTFDKSFPDQTNKKKIWEERGISKDEFFMRKYGNISEDQRKKLKEKVERQRRLRALRVEHESSKLDKKPKREVSPLVNWKLIKNPMSDYLYGTHPVLSALMSNKRGGFNRLIALESIKDSKDDKHLKIKQLCKNFGIKITYEPLRQNLDRISDRGVHNGVILETRKLSPPLVESLLKVDKGGEYQLKFYEESYGNSTTESFQIARKEGQFPLALYLDGITDPQNAGAIMRLAYYLGVDFVIVPEHDSARLGPAASKSSGGALELMSIYKNDNAIPFLEDAKGNGWGVLVADAKPTADQLKDLNENYSKHLVNKYVETSDLSDLLEQMPILLVMGSEGAGVRTNIKLRADFLVGLEKSRHVNDDDIDSIVDSLNVSVATALLIEKCLSK